MRLIEPPVSGQDRGNTDFEAALDWLECVAIVNPNCRAQLRAVLDNYRIEDDEPESDQIDDSSYEDAELAEIETLHNLRKEALGDAYPFELSENGTELIYLRDSVGHPADAYIMCLLVSANRRLPGGWHSELDHLKLELTQRIIQLVATVALAGVAKGPAISLGWPRENDPTIIGILNRAAGMGSCVVPNEKPNLLIARSGDKDGGVDILAWERVIAPQATPGHVWLGQVASGLNWIDKSVIQDRQVFMEGYIHSPGTPNWNGATIIPFTRDRDHIRRSQQDYRHGKILDRHSLPTYFAEGLRLYAAGVPMDESVNVPELARWNREMIAALT